MIFYVFQSFVILLFSESKSSDCMLEDDFNHLYQEIIAKRQDSVIPRPALQIELSHLYPDSISQRLDSQPSTPAPLCDSSRLCEGNVPRRQDIQPSTPASQLVIYQQESHWSVPRRRDSSLRGPSPLLEISRRYPETLSRRHDLLPHTSKPMSKPLLDSSHQGSVCQKQDSLPSTPRPVPLLELSRLYPESVSYEMRHYVLNQQVS